ncbi:MAG: pyridoxamine 5'-phosphate oxidase family protein, partial [Pseudomonadota bacterium]
MTPDKGHDVACGLIANQTAVLAWTDAKGPNISRIGTAYFDQAIYALLSDLSPHTAALIHTPNCALLFGDAGDKGDPLNHPRLSLQVTATKIDKRTLR